jgi:hypothetical protein
MRVRPDAGDDVQVAARPAAHSRAAFVGDADAGTIAGAGRYLHLQPLRLDDRSSSLADVAQGVGDLAAAAAGGAALLAWSWSVRVAPGTPLPA